MYNEQNRDRKIYPAPAQQEPLNVHFKNMKCIVVQSEYLNFSIN